jgi:hypothetical protein
MIEYLASGLLACLAAAVLALRVRDRLDLFQRPYWNFLLVPWKVGSFAIAASAMVLIAPYTGDPTWDAVDASFMSVLAFTTAPWAVGTIYRWLCGRSTGGSAYIAAWVWLFSVSLTYDLYILLRDGVYASTWLPNIPASSCLYVCAGLMWSLESRPGRGLVFAFTEPAWFSTNAKTAFLAVAPIALVFMALAVGMIGSFLL